MRTRRVAAVVVTCGAFAAGLLLGGSGGVGGVDPAIASDERWAAARGPIVVAVGPDLPPAYFADATGAVTRGFMVEAVSLAAARAGVTVRFERHADVGDAVRAAVLGDADLVVAAERADVVAGGLQPTGTFASPQMVLLAADEDLGSRSDRSGLTGWAVPGSPMEEVLRTRYPEVRMVERATPAEAIADAARGEIDVVLGTLAQYGFVARTLGVELHVIEDALGAVEPRLYGPPGSPQLRLLERGRVAVGDVELARINERWTGFPLLALDRRSAGGIHPGAGLAAVVALGLLLGVSARSHRLARVDPVTGLPNRRQLMADLSRSLRSGGTTTVLFADLDGFKRVNDTLGHATGDLVLRGLADAVAAWLPSGSVAYRLAGDEFVVVTTSPRTGPSEAAGAADGLAGSLAELMARPIPVEGRPIALSASIGVAVSELGDGPSDLLARADGAMYEAKEHGRNRRSHAVAGSASPVSRGAWADVDDLVARSEVVVAYQPIVEVATGEVRGAEALARLSGPGAHLAPDVFIPVVEATGRIVAIGEAVLEQAVRARALDPGAGFVSVNVSPVELLRPGWSEAVLGLLARHGVPHEELMIEVTESAAVELRDHAMLVELRERGVLVALDDFGTGTSSLSRLQDLPITHVKLDGSFVRSLRGDADAALGVLRALASLAEQCGVAVIHEGVETVAEMLLLAEVGSALQQGYHHGRPGPALPALGQAPGTSVPGGRTPSSVSG